MVVDPETYFSRVYVRGSYEPHIVQYFKKILRPGMTCIDVGANVGYYTLLMARRVGVEGQVFSFEPTYRTFNVLQENIRLNHLKQLTADRIALFDHAGSLQFHEGPPGFDVYNSAGEVTHRSATNQIFTISSVPCVALDAYLGARSIRQVDVIKIDVEGAELPVLKGMENVLRANSRAILVIEYNDGTTRGFGYSASDVGTWLVERGWQLSCTKTFGRIAPISVDQHRVGQTIVVSRPCSAHQ